MSIQSIPAFTVHCFCSVVLFCFVLPGNDMKDLCPLKSIKLSLWSTTAKITFGDLTCKMFVQPFKVKICKFKKKTYIHFLTDEMLIHCCCCLPFFETICGLFFFFFLDLHYGTRSVNIALTNQFLVSIQTTLSILNCVTFPMSTPLHPQTQLELCSIHVLYVIRI